MLETKISYNLLYQDVLSKLKEYIKSNNLKVGDKLPPERELAVLFDISRGTLRQAFRILENSGIVIVKTGGGRFINRLPEDNSKLSKIIDNLLDTDILDVIEMRMALEKKSIELAIKNLTEKDVLMLIDNIENTRSRNNKNNFHLLIAQISRNNVIYNTIELNIFLIKEIQRKMLKKPGRWERMIEEHVKIYNAIVNKNTKKAQKFLLEHLENTKKDLKIIIE